MAHYFVVRFLQDPHNSVFSWGRKLSQFGSLSQNLLFVSRLPATSNMSTRQWLSVLCSFLLEASRRDTLAMTFNRRPSQKWLEGRNLQRNAVHQKVSH